MHPVNADARSMLGFCLFMTHDYAETLRVLEPIEANLGTNAALRMAYAGSMALAGDYSLGLARLEAIEEAEPDNALVHYLLGEAYARRERYDQSAGELGTAVKLDPLYRDAKNALAGADLVIGKKAEALQLLSELAKTELKDGEFFCRLAQLQIELGSVDAAIGSLETAIRINPMDAAYHQDLAEAYRQNAQPEKAERESLQSETLQALIESNLQPGSGNSASTSHSGNPSRIQRN
jgi:tetratricopeptide (TPR) repeat protein